MAAGGAGPHKDPSRRPTAQQLLDRLLGREQVSVASVTQAVSDAWTPVLPATPEPAPAPRRRPVTAPLTAPLTASALAVLITAGVLLALWRPWAGTEAGARPKTVVSTVVETITDAVTVTAGSTPSGSTRTTRPKTVVQTGTIKPGTERAETTFRHSNWLHSNVPARAHVTAVTRKGDIVRIEVTITNDGERGFIDLETLFSGADATSLENVQLFVPGAPFPVTPLRQDGKCACTTWEGESRLGAGEAMHLYASFRDVPKDAKTVDIDLPTVATFRNVLITDR